MRTFVPFAGDKNNFKGAVQSDFTSFSELGKQNVQAKKICCCYLLGFEAAQASYGNFS